MSARAARRPDEGRDPVAAVAFVAFALVALALAVADVAAFAATVGLGTVLVWYALGTPYAIAVAHAGAVGLFPDGIDPGTFAALEAPLVAAVLAPARRTARPLGYAAVALACAAVFGGAAWLALEHGSLPLASGALLACVALAAYGVHRYELVRLGLVPGLDDSASSDAPASTSASTERNDGDTT